MHRRDPGDECTAKELMAGTINVLGVRIRHLSVDELHAQLDYFITSRQPARVLNVNAHGLNLSQSLPWLRQYFNDSDLVFADGVGVAIAARMLGHRVTVTRIPLTDWIWDLAGFAASRGFSMFLLGSRPGIAERASERLLARHQSLRIIGTHHGYFDKTTDSAANREVIGHINRVRPDILLVGFGMPLQERWLMENWSQIDARVAITGGAVMDYTAGELRRGPRILTDHGLEWLARLVIEPRRLWQRYVLGNPLFLWRVARQRVAGAQSAYDGPPGDHGNGAG